MFRRRKREADFNLQMRQILTPDLGLAGDAMRAATIVTPNQNTSIVGKCGFVVMQRERNRVPGT